MWTVFVLVGAVSVVTHLVLLNIMLLPQQAANLKSIASSMRARSARRARLKRTGIDWLSGLELAIPILVVLGCILMDYVVLSAFVKSYRASGSFLVAALEAAPHLFELINEFLADLMAEVIFVGFIPGGRAGIIIGGLASFALNVLEVILLVSWIRKGRQSRKYV